MATQDIENRNCVVIHGVDDNVLCETENVVMNAYHHDNENGTSTRSAEQDGQANMSPPCAEHSADI